MVNEKLTSFYTRNIRYYYNVDILAKKLLMYNLPYSTNMFMRNYYDNKVRYSYEEVEMKKRVKYSLDRLYSVRKEKQHKLTQIKNSAKPYDLDNIKSKSIDNTENNDTIDNNIDDNEPIIDCERSSIFNMPKISGMSIFGKKSTIDDELLFKIFQQEVYTNILYDIEIAKLEAEKEAEKEAIKHFHLSNPEETNINVISSNEYIEAARQEAEKEAMRQAVIHAEQSRINDNDDYSDNFEDDSDGDDSDDDSIGENARRQRNKAHEQFNQK